MFRFTMTLNSKTGALVGPVYASLPRLDLNSVEDNEKPEVKIYKLLNSDNRVEIRENDQLSGFYNILLKASLVSLKI